jgi:hypothetical protein
MSLNILGFGLATPFGIYVAARIFGFTSLKLSLADRKFVGDIDSNHRGEYQEHISIISGSGLDHKRSRIGSLPKRGAEPIP